MYVEDISGFFTKLFAFGFLSSLCLHCHRLNAQSNQLPPAVVSSLEKYSKLEAARWSWEGTYAYVFDGKNAKYSTKGSYVRSSNRFAIVTQLKEGKKDILDHSVRFDGKTLAQSNGAVAQSDGINQMSWYQIDKIAKTQPHNFRFSVPYFDAIGIQYPKENKSLVEGQFKSKILALLEEGGTLVRCVDEVLGSIPVTVVEIDGKYEAISFNKKSSPERVRWIYFLSNRDDYAVLKHERRTLAGAKWLECDVSSFFENSLDFPRLGKSVSVKNFVSLSEEEFTILPISQETTSVVAQSPHIIPTTDDDFVLKKESAKAGTQLIDAVTPELQKPNGSVSVFNMPASPEDLDKAIAAASVKRSYGSTVTWLIGLAVITAAGFGAYFKYRKSH